MIEILHKGYLFGDKTLAQGISRTPWLAKINNEDNWVFNETLIHGVSKPESNIPIKIKELLHKELLEYINSYNKVGILLSGGLDSRIIAGVLKEAQLKKDYSGNVVFYNWEIPKLRNVIYAEKTANLYDWEYVYHPLTPESLKDNFIPLLQ